MKSMNEKHSRSCVGTSSRSSVFTPTYIEDELGKPALDERVLTAMLRVPRHFLSPNNLPASRTRTTSAYRIREDDLTAVHVRSHRRPLAPEPEDIVLEVGTGLGYQTACWPNL